MSEHDKTSLHDVPEVHGIHTEPAPFEPGYQPGTVPHISVPDLPDDAEGLTAEALAQVPTLTELVSDAAPEVEPVSAPVAEAALPEITLHDVSATQDMTAQADTWTEALHVRMGKLTDDIHTLNTRLDRLEERNKTKA